RPSRPRRPADDLGSRAPRRRPQHRVVLRRAEWRGRGALRRPRADLRRRAPADRVGLGGLALAEPLGRLPPPRLPGSRHLPRRAPGRTLTALITREETMNYTSFTTADGVETWGVERDGYVYDLGPTGARVAPTLKDAIAAGKFSGSLVVDESAPRH